MEHIGKLDFILHIGAGKCGSSSIQRAMISKRECLRAQGLIYESSAPSGTHFSLIALCGKATRGSPSEQKNQAEKTVKMIQTATRNGDKVVLSAENLMLSPRRDVITILSQITDNIGNLDVIAYLRSPSSLYLSWVQQMLKGSSTFSAPQFYRPRFDQALRVWRDWELVENLVVHNFDRRVLYRGDVVQDFAQALNQVSGRNVVLEAKETNVSLSAEQMVVVQRFRRTILPSHDGRLMPESAQLITFFQKMNEIAPMGNKARLLPSVTAEIAKNNYNMVRRLNSMFPELHLKIDNNIETSSGDEKWRTSSDVKDLLDKVDDSEVERIASLVPQLSPPLKTGLTSEARNALSFLLSEQAELRERQIDRLMKYWKAVKCDEAVAGLRSLRN